MTFPPVQNAYTAPCPYQYPVLVWNGRNVLAADVDGGKWYEIAPRCSVASVTAIPEPPKEQP